MAIDRDRLLTDNWPFVLHYFDVNFRRLELPFVKDRLWDLAVDVFLKTVRQWRGVGTFRGYYLFCVQRTWKKYLKRYRGSPRTLQGYFNFNRDDYRLARDCSDFEQLDRDDYFENHSRLLNSDQRRLLLDLREGWKAQELADRNGRHLGDQKTRMHRLRKLLRKTELQLTSGE